MDEQQWDGTLNSTLLMHVVHVQLAEPSYCNCAREHGECVQLPLMCGPVIAILPPANKPPDVAKWCTTVLPCYIDIVWWVGILELALD
jgi:hypothetical protein